MANEETESWLVKVRKRFGANASRFFAWAIGVSTLGWIFALTAFRGDRVLDPDPIPGHEWVQYPERYVYTGPLEPLREHVGTFLLVLLALWVVALIVHLWGRVPREARAWLDEEKEELRLQRWAFDRVIPLSEIVGVLEQPGETVLLQLRSGASVELAAAHLPEGLASAKQTATLPTGIGWQSVAGGSVLRWVSALGGFGLLAPWLVKAGEAVEQGGWASAVVPLVLMLVWAGVGLLGSGNQRVTIGRDGVRVDRPWGKRFVHFKHIARVSDVGGVIHFELADGKSVRVGTANAQALARRLRRELSAHREADVVQLSDEHRRLLARGERDVSRWSEDLAKLEAEQDYRREAVRIADLEELVGDPRADPEQRIAAALALPKSDEVRQRIRVAAEASADVDTRAALEAAAEDAVAEARLARAVKRFRAE